MINGSLELNTINRSEKIGKVSLSVTIHVGIESRDIIYNINVTMSDQACLNAPIVGLQPTSSESSTSFII
jgi:hypothetical protein